MIRTLQIKVKNQTHAKLSWFIDSDEENQFMYREGELLNCGAASLGVVQDELVLSTKVVSCCNFSGRMITTLPMRVND